VTSEHFLWTALLPIPAVSVAIARRGRLVPFYLPLVVLTVIGYGHLRLDATHTGTDLTPRYVFFLASLATGYIVVWRVARPIQARPRTHESPDRLWVLLYGAAFVAMSILVLLHYARVGIPVFDPNVETARLQLGVSGLLGLPSRALLFGIPILVAGIVFLHSKRLRYAFPLYAAALAVFVATRALSGYRSALLEVLFTLYVATLPVHHYPRPDLRRALRYIAAACVAVLFALGLSFTYATVRNLHGSNVVESLAERVSTQAALPARLLITEQDLQPYRPTSVYRNDIVYMLEKYLGVGEGDHYSTSQIIAATQFQISEPSAIRGLVSVTTGAFGELTVELGIFAAILAMATGMLFAGGEIVAARSGGPLVYTSAAALLLALIDWLTKGNGVYVLVNWGTVLAAVLLLLTCGERLLTRARPG